METGINNVDDNKGKSLIRSQEEDDSELEVEEFPEEFRCCICLELLYKPVVLACGHISCFWCIYKAMNFWNESHCPICRHPYNHFPSICQLLHFLLLKLYPIGYERRERQVGEEEKEVGYFSPQFDHNSCEPQHIEELGILNNTHALSDTQLKSCSKKGDNKPIEPAKSLGKDEAMVNETDQECSSLGNNVQHRAQKLVSFTDLPCAACKKLLFRPIVLNCGHVYCESCTFVLEGKVPRCQICQSFQPNGLPNVCLILDHFLEEQFPDIYSERKKALLIEGSRQAQKKATSSSGIPKNVHPLSWWLGSGPKVHRGVGCDCCGMYPIIGERYKCKDCLEKVGFDLCEGCYNSPTKVPGRFNQQHKPEHNFEIVQPLDINYTLSMPNPEQSDEDGSDYPEYLDDAPQTPTFTDDVLQDQGDSSHEPEDVSPASLLSVDVFLNKEDGSDKSSI
ncbi:hypothetical protein SLE2022_256120 [Rubroshorea leprosula]